MDADASILDELLSNRCSNEQRVLDAVTTLVGSSIDTADRDDLASITALNATLKAYTAYVDIRISRRANVLKSAGESAGGFATLLDGNGSASDATAAEERNRACDPDRTLTWTRPDGSVWITHPSTNRQPPTSERQRQRRPAA